MNACLSQPAFRRKHSSILLARVFYLRRRRPLLTSMTALASSRCPTVNEYLLTLIELGAEVRGVYSDELWGGVKAALGVLTSLSLAKRGNPLTLIFEGASGRGKSTIVNMFTLQVRPRRDSFIVWTHLLPSRLLRTRPTFPTISQRRSTSYRS